MQILDGSLFWLGLGFGVTVLAGWLWRVVASVRRARLRARRTAIWIEAERAAEAAARLAPIVRRGPLASRTEPAHRRADPPTNGRVRS